MTIKERYEAIIEYFRQENPSPTTELHFNNPFETLVAVILSAQCMLSHPWKRCRYLRRSEACFGIKEYYDRGSERKTEESAGRIGGSL